MEEDEGKTGKREMENIIGRGRRKSGRRKKGRKGNRLRKRK